MARCSCERTRASSWRPAPSTPACCCSEAASGGPAGGGEPALQHGIAAHGTFQSAALLLRGPADLALSPSPEYPIACSKRGSTPLRSSPCSCPAGSTSTRRTCTSTVGWRRRRRRRHVLGWQGPSPGSRANSASSPQPLDMDRLIEGLKLTGRMFLNASARTRVMPATLRYHAIDHADRLDELDVYKTRPGLSLNFAHPQGGNAISVNADRGVVDPSFRVHGIPNLYVCDASVFPSSITVNPQFTVMALAHYAATKIGGPPPPPAAVPTVPPSAPFERFPRDRVPSPEQPAGDRRRRSRPARRRPARRGRAPRRPRARGRRRSTCSTRSFIQFSAIARSRAGTPSGAAPRARSASIAAVVSCTKPSMTRAHSSRTSALVAARRRPPASRRGARGTSRRWR